MYNYRRAVEGDYDTICSFPQNQEQLFYMFPKAIFPLTPTQIEEGTQNRMHPTVIIHQNEVAAYANLYDADGEACFLGNVIVSPRYRGKGVSKVLVEVMSAIARDELKVKTLKLVCHNTNTRGILLYTAMGFTPFDILRIVKPSGEKIAGVRMYKALS